MDDVRKIRLLIPPFFLIGSLLWGLWCDHQTSLNTLMPGIKLDDPIALLSLIAGGGLIVVTFGFLLGTITIFFLRTIFKCFGKNHEVAVSGDAMQRIQKHLSIPDELCNKKNEFFTGVAFDHETLKNEKEGIHLWLVRRWSGFNISANSTTALILSLLFGKFLGIEITSDWLLTLIPIILLLVWSATMAWLDSMGMVEFQARRFKAMKKKKKKKEK